MKLSKHFISFAFFYFISINIHAAEDSANLVAIGQGISSPSSTSTVNYTSGLTIENPNGVLYQNDFRLSLQYDQNDSSPSSKNYGAEFGYGNKSVGFALGYRKPDCNNCDGKSAADLAINFGGVGFGLKFAENIVGVGLLFGVTNTHRFGVVADVNDSGGTGNKVTTYGLGYSYVANNFTLTLDASKANYENNSAAPDVLLLSPGIMVRAESIQLSVTDRITVDNTNKTQKDDLWFGLGFGSKSWHFVGYSDYVNDLALVASFYF